MLISMASGSYHSLVRPMLVYVANNVKRTTAKFHSTSDYIEGVVSSSNQHNCTDTVCEVAIWR